MTRALSVGLGEVLCGQVFDSPLSGVIPQHLDVLGQVLLVDPPHSAMADLEGAQLTRPHQRVDLRQLDVEDVGHFLWAEQRGKRHLGGPLESDNGYVSQPNGAWRGMEAPS